MKQKKTIYTVVIYEEEYTPSYLVYLTWLYNHGKLGPSFRVYKQEKINLNKYIIYSDRAEFIRIGELVESTVSSKEKTK